MTIYVRSVTGVAISPIIVTNTYLNPFNIGMGAVVTGTATYTVEHTFDDTTTVASPTWFPNSTLTAQTTSKDANYAYPVRAVRLNVTAGTGTVVLTLVQAGDS
jgi:hypothetical protein